MSEKERENARKRENEREKTRTFPSFHDKIQYNKKITTNDEKTRENIRTENKKPREYPRKARTHQYSGGKTENINEKFCENMRKSR